MSGREGRRKTGSHTRILHGDGSVGKSARGERTSELRGNSGKVDAPRARGHTPGTPLPHFGSGGASPASDFLARLATSYSVRSAPGSIEGADTVKRCARQNPGARTHPCGERARSRGVREEVYQLIVPLSSTHPSWAPILTIDYIGVL